ncbi:hypothetical protein BDV27DRAFT_149654 [Aspergillus caelatus]|uniref:Uncharacterized protein n=1 Tax=Aspergillus caelatus TaxID=61420 RepID=A0A5N6ZSY5_9EURO|nr:uncharacterized protein BDV27DRAFT_149654 [Aspergillus caelatus]KAE8359370.1 hypothetical protein BDV27DRAFT_149654 [Aspergillus caelatus]
MTIGKPYAHTEEKRRINKKRIIAPTRQVGEAGSRGHGCAGRMGQRASDGSSH